MKNGFCLNYSLGLYSGMCFQNIVVSEFIIESTFKLFLIKGNKVLYSGKVNAQTKLGIIKILNEARSTLPLVVNKDELDKAQIIYSYLKSGNCRYRIIPDEWLGTGNESLIEDVLEKLLCEKQGEFGQNSMETPKTV